MALTCISGGRECDGCMKCQEEHGEVIGHCDNCSDPIYENENYYDIEGILLHDDCLCEWAKQFKK